MSKLKVLFARLNIWGYYYKIVCLILYSMPLTVYYILLTINFVVYFWGLDEGGRATLFAILQLRVPLVGGVAPMQVAAQAEVMISLYYLR